MSAWQRVLLTFLIHNVYEEKLAAQVGKLEDIQQNNMNKEALEAVQIVHVHVTVKDRRITAFTSKGAQRYINTSEV